MSSSPFTPLNPGAFRAPPPGTVIPQRTYRDGNIVGNFFGSMKDTVMGIPVGALTLAGAGLKDAARLATFGQYGDQFQLDDVARGIVSYYKNESPFGALAQGNFGEAYNRFHNDPFNPILDVASVGLGAAKLGKANTIKRAQAGDLAAKQRILNKPSLYKIMRLPDNEVRALQDMATTSVDDFLHAGADAFDFNPATGEVTRAAKNSAKGTLPYRGSLMDIGGEKFIRGEQRLVRPAASNRSMLTPRDFDMDYTAPVRDRGAVSGIGPSEFGSYKAMSDNPIVASVGDLIEDARAKYIPGNWKLIGNDRRIEVLKDKYHAKNFMNQATPVTEESEEAARQYLDDMRSDPRFSGYDANQVDKLATFAATWGLRRGARDTATVFDHLGRRADAVGHMEAYAKRIAKQISEMDRRINASISPKLVSRFKATKNDLAREAAYVQERIDSFRAAGDKAAKSGVPEAYKSHIKFALDNAEDLDYIMQTAAADRWYKRNLGISKATRAIFAENRQGVLRPIDLDRSPYSNWQDVYGVLDEDTVKALKADPRLREPLQFSRSVKPGDPIRGHAGLMDGQFNERTAKSGKMAKGTRDATDTGIDYFSPESLSNPGQTLMQHIAHQHSRNLIADNFRGLSWMDANEAGTLRKAGVIGSLDDVSNSPFVAMEDVIPDLAQMDNINKFFQAAGDEILVNRLLEEGVYSNMGLSVDEMRKIAKADVEDFRKNMSSLADYDADKFTQVMQDPIFNYANEAYDMMSSVNRGDTPTMARFEKAGREARMAGKAHAASKGDPLMTGTAEQMFEDSAGAAKMSQDVTRGKNAVPVMPRAAAEALYKNAVKGREAWMEAFDKSTDWWKVSVLHLRPEWYLNNAAGMWMLYALKHGTPSAIKSGLEHARAWAKTKKMMPHLDDAKVVYDKSTAMSGATQSVDDIAKGVADTPYDDALRMEQSQARTSGTSAPGIATARTEHRMKKAKYSSIGGKQSTAQLIADKFHKFRIRATELNSALFDDPPRHAALRKSVDKHVAEFRQAMTDMDSSGTLARMSDEQLAVYLQHNASFRMRVMEDVFSDMINFRDMTDVERRWVARLIPFYSWMKGATKVGLNAPVKHPFRTAGWRAMGQYGNEIVDDFFGLHPSYYNEYLPIGDKYVSLAGMNPLTTAADVVSMASQFLPIPGVDRTFGSENLIGTINPFLKAMIETPTGTDLFTGAQTPYPGKLGNDSKWTDRFGQMGPGINMFSRFAYSIPQIKLANQLLAANHRSPNAGPGTYLGKYMGLPMPETPGFYMNQVANEERRATGG